MFHVSQPVLLRRGAPRDAAVQLRDRAALLAARALRRVIVASGLGAGGALPGRVADRLAPGLLARAAPRLGPVALVSGTNGKTTTTALLAAALAADGRRVLSNATGSNLHQGLVATVACARGPVGCAVFEVDEASLARAAAELHPRLLVLLNLSRDQLDRHHEVHALAASWRRAVEGLPPSATVVAVDHDPLVCHAAEAAPRLRTVGVVGARPGRDASGCPVCGDVLGPAGGDVPRADAGDVPGADGGEVPGGEGGACPACGWRRPPRAVEVLRCGATVTLRDRPGGTTLRATLPLPAPGYAADAAAAWTAAVALGVEPRVALDAIAAVRGVQARYAELPFGADRVRLLLAKNPAGWDEALAVTGEPDRPAVIALHAGIPDGRDTSWIWDVDMAALRGRPAVVASGRRAADVAVRLAAGERRRRDGGREAAVDLFADYSSFRQARRLLEHA